MKVFNQKIFFLSTILFLFGFLYASGQTKTVSLYNFILSGLPDSIAPTNLVSWQKGISGNYPTFKGAGKNPVKENGEYYKKVFVNLDVAGERFDEVNADISGKTLKGYSSFSISLPMSENFSGVDISQLKKEGYSTTLLNPGSEVLWYKVKFPNKKNVWMVSSEEYITAHSNWFVISVYFDDSEFKKAIKKK